MSRCRGGTCRHWKVDILGAYWAVSSIMSSTTLTLMHTDLHGVTWRAAEGEDTLLLICPPTHALPYSLQLHVNSQKRSFNFVFSTLYSHLTDTPFCMASNSITIRQSSLKNHSKRRTYSISRSIHRIMEQSCYNLSVWLSCEVKNTFI